MKHPLLLSALGALVLAACSNHGATSVLPSSPIDSAATQQVTSEAGFATGAPESRLGAVGFIVGLPLRNSVELDRLLTAIADPESPQYRHFITREAFLQRYAPSTADLVAVARDMRAAGLNVSILDQAVSAGGTQASVERYFGTRLTRDANGHLAAASEMRLPRTLAVRNASVLGLNGSPQVHTFSHFIPAPASVRPDNFASAIGPYYPIDLKQAYKMPSYQEATGRGSKIGIVIDSAVSLNDITAFARLMRAAVPKVVIKKIDGGGAINADAGEATLDVQQSGGIAPGAAITVYDIGSIDSGKDIYDGYAAAVKDGATVVNSSWGGCEIGMSQASLKIYDNVFKQGLASGTTFVAASGDYGAYQCGAGGSNVQLGVVWPADSIYVLAVGGTNLQTAFVTGSNNAAYVSESANKDIAPNNGGKYFGSGGGISTLYKRPSWQNGFNSKSGRGLPDVALHMGGLGFSGTALHPNCLAEKCSPGDSSDWTVVGGQPPSLAVGTSASSPDMVGLLALAAEIQGKPAGDVHATLYAAAKKSGLLRHGIKGNNGLPTTSGLWDPVLGLGTPISGSALVGGTTVAGLPGSSSNP